MDDYNSEQLSAIHCMAATVIVPAGPGSGKSHTLVGRIRYRVENGIINPKRVVVLTFTNNGARVFAERLAAFDIRVQWMGTVHSYCMRVIQKHGDILGYRIGKVTVVTDEARAELIAMVRADLGFKITDKALKEATHSTIVTDHEARLILREYQHRLKRANMIDHDGILRDGLTLLQNVSVKTRAQSGLELDELLVDERQDSGAIDSEVFWSIPAATRFFVGDGDQCIFAFRGAMPNLFADEARRYGFIALTKNYRSDKSICRAANLLINHNTQRIPKPIEPVSIADGLTAVMHYQHDGDEIYGVWAWIKDEMASGVSPSQIAVLARTNDIVSKYRDALRGLGVPVNSRRFRRIPADWPLALNAVGLLVNPGNDLLAEAVLRCSGMREDALRAMKIKAADQDQFLSTVALLPNTPPVMAIDGLTLIAMMGVSPESVALIKERLETLQPPRTMSDLLVDLTNPDRWGLEHDLEEAEPAEHVTVSTIHGAKGSEWDSVFIVGLEEGILPIRQATDEKAIEEERRLCFVAVTRARHRLHLTWAQTRNAYNHTYLQEPSRFIREMGFTP